MRCGVGRVPLESCIIRETGETGPGRQSWVGHLTRYLRVPLANGSGQMDRRQRLGDGSFHCRPNHIFSTARGQL
jgi:hypothetical protein